ncbi:MAG TPA: hypothetical protein VMV04_11420 [Thermodesulfobacteriota bacterium]|nr:hypothetical protein [Thermodesulfobacteriota bacterium]
MKKKMILLIIGLSLVVASAIAVPKYPDRYPTFNSLCKAFLAGMAMESEGALP